MTNLNRDFVIRRVDDAKAREAPRVEGQRKGTILEIKPPLFSAGAPLGGVGGCILSPDSSSLANSDLASFFKMFPLFLF